MSAPEGQFLTLSSGSESWPEERSLSGHRHCAYETSTPHRVLYPLGSRTPCAATSAGSWLPAVHSARGYPSRFRKDLAARREPRPLGARSRGRKSG